ncbi:MAG: orotidine-5'-phosphate decarboxylase [Eubacterium sp.]|jgi:orotidine-5'-phosphate decarboxylase|nr:orotidine-5'-phosphate decarboxylase [Eubacterium sp.]
MSLDCLIEKICELQNPTVVGLDPKLDFIPDFIKKRAFEKFGENLEGAAEAIFEFNKCLIDAIFDIVPAVKPQTAYYELYGHAGVAALFNTQKYACEKGLYVITDGKRNDIGTTMEAYAFAHLGKIKIGDKSFNPFISDSLTVNGYLGTDGIAPLLKIAKEHDKSIFVLLKTSNPSSGELQDLKLENGATVYEHMGKMCAEWGKELPGKYGFSGVGAVVGATYPDQIAKLRNMLPGTFFLIPGYGAQGGKAKDIAAAFFRNGLGGIVNSSRAIMCAYQNEGCDESDFAGAARREVIRMREELRSVCAPISVQI